MINCAAYTAVDQAEDEPKMAHQLNAVAIDYLCQLSKAFGFKLIHFSTDYVFDGNGNEPNRPLDRTNPINIYGKSKAEGEKIINDSVWIF